MRIFILEDEPARIKSFMQATLGHEVLVCSTADIAKTRFKPPYDLILLDHDLGGKIYCDPANEDTGSGFVRWLIDKKKIDKDMFFIIHSFNYGGAMNMMDRLKDLDIKWDAPPQRWVFGHSLLDWLRSRA